MRSTIFQGIAMKSPFRTRTQIAQELGVTVATLKKHMIRADILDSSGKSPSIRAHLDDMVEWRVIEKEQNERFFVLDINKCREKIKTLVETTSDRPVLITNKHKAATLLENAADHLAKAMDVEKAKARKEAAISPSNDRDQDPDVECAAGEKVFDYDAATEEMIWLSFESAIPCLTAYDKYGKECLLRQLDQVQKQIADHEKEGVYISGHPDLAEARKIIRAVEMWYEGGKPNAAPAPQGNTPPPPKVRVFYERRMHRMKMGEGDVREFVKMEASEEEIKLLKSGYTLRILGNVTGRLQNEFITACLWLFGYEEEDIKQIETESRYLFGFSRISRDGKTLLFSNWSPKADFEKTLMVASLNIEIDGSTITLTKADSVENDEMHLIASNARAGHFDDERAEVELI